MTTSHPNDSNLLRFCTGLIGSLMTTAGLITLSETRHMKTIFAGLLLLGMGLASIIFTFTSPRENQEHRRSSSFGHAPPMRKKPMKDDHEANKFYMRNH